MFTVFVRTIIIYAILIATMRILGKRQLGELEISELITTILLSEIASLPITNKDIPILYAIIPLATITAFEIAASFLIAKFPKIKGIFSTRPSTLVNDGVIDQKELLKNRISSEELISELRLKGITDINCVKYAILEENGLLSVIPKAEHQQPTLEQLNIAPNESGISHIIISQGKWNEYNLKILKKNKKDIEKYLKSKKVAISDVFLLLVDDNDKYDLITKQKKSRRLF